MAVKTMRGFRRRVCKIFESGLMHAIISSLIFLSLLGMGLETSPEIMDAHGLLISKINALLVFLFALEILIRIFGHGANFFKSPWNTFDFIIVTLAVLTFGGFLQVFRAIRLLWFMRLITIFPHFRHMVGAIIRSIPGLVAILVLLILTIYICGVIATFEYGSTTPELFFDLKTAMSSMSRAMLMPHKWSHMLETLEKSHENAWMFVIPSLIILNYLLLHLVLGIIISAVDSQYKDDEEHMKIGVLARLRLGKIQTVEHDAISAETKLILHHIKDMAESFTKNKLKK